MQTGSSEERALPVPRDSHGSSTSTSFTARPVLSPSTALRGRRGGRRGGHGTQAAGHAEAHVQSPRVWCRCRTEPGGPRPGRSCPPPGSASGGCAVALGTTPSSSRTSFLVRTHVAADVGELPNSVGAPRTGGEAPRAASSGGPGLGALGPLSRGCSAHPVTSCSSRLSLRHISLTLPATFRGRNSTRADYEYQHSNLYAISGRWGHSGRVPGTPPSVRLPGFLSAFDGLSLASLFSSLQGACSRQGPGLAFP